MTTKKDIVAIELNGDQAYEFSGFIAEVLEFPENLGNSKIRIESLILKSFENNGAHVVAQYSDNKDWKFTLIKEQS